MKKYLISGLLIILFIVSAYFFLNTYHRYVLNQERLRVANREARLVKQYQQEMKRKERILAQVNTFVTRAKASGIEKNRWAYYNVNIQEAVSFPEISGILTQTVNTSSYYFKPVAFYAKRAPQPQIAGPAKKPSSTSAASPETKKEDILLTLRGAFVVRQ